MKDYKDSYVVVNQDGEFWTGGGTWERGTPTHTLEFTDDIESAIELDLEEIEEEFPTMPPGLKKEVITFSMYKR